MAVEILAWNVLDAFSDERRAREVLQVIGQQRPDAAVFSEAWREDKAGLLDDVLDDLGRSGYHTVHGLYDDDDGRQDRHGIMGIVRTPAVGGEPQIISLGSRNAVHLPVIDPVAPTHELIDVFGVHLDDRTEERRLAQTEALIALAAASVRTVVAGDLNAMHQADPRAKALRSAGPVIRRMPTVEPRPDYRPPKFRRLGSLASRLYGMAKGTTMERFEAAGFVDVDDTHPGTKGPFNLDHILVRGLAADRRRALPKYPASDHRAIGASVYTKRS